MAIELTQEYLKECLDYDYLTGIFTWKERPLHHFKNEKYCNIHNKIHSGKETGKGGNNICGKIHLLGKNYQSSIVAFLYVNGKFPYSELCYLDGDKSNNRIGNIFELCDTKKVIFGQNYLKSVLDYNETTGLFTWKPRPLNDFNKLSAYSKYNKKNLGKNAGCKCNKYGYIKIQLGKQYRAHRLAFLYSFGYMPKEVDHINNIRDDNRLINLRESTTSQNRQNLKVCLKNNKNGFLGVTFLKRDNKFRAMINKDKKHIFLGVFDTPEEAHNVYLNAKRRIHEFNTL